MGVHSITGYIEKYALTKPVPHHRPINVVIDGSSLIHHLYFLHLDWILGSQYTFLVQLVNKFLSELEHNNIQVKKIVFDGGRACLSKSNVRIIRDLDRAKSAYTAMKSIAKTPILQLDELGLPILLDECKSSSRNRRAFHVTQPVLPVLASMLIVHHLRTCGFDVMVAIGEADQVVAQLANQLHAYVIANDSDYYIYPLDLGYIRLETICNHLSTTVVDCAGIQAFHHNLLSESINTLDAYWFPVLACCLGNDYVEFEELGELIIQQWHSGPSSKNKSAILRTKSVATFIRDRVLQAKLTPNTDPIESVIPHIIHYLLTNPPALSTTPSKANSLNMSRTSVLNTAYTSMQKQRQLKVSASKAANASINPLRRQIKTLTIDDLDSSVSESSSDSEPDHARRVTSAASILPIKQPIWAKTDPTNTQLWTTHPKFRILKTGIDEYVLDQPVDCLMAEVDATPTTYSRKPTKAQLYAMIRHGHVPPAMVDIIQYKTFICKPLMEDITRSSCWMPSLNVRLRAYTYLPLPSDGELITETGRFTPKSLQLDEYHYIITTSTEIPVTSTYLYEPIRAMNSGVDVIVCALSLLVYDWDRVNVCDVPPSMDLILSTLMAVLSPIHPPAMHQVRLTGLVHHWCSTVECMLLSMMLDWVLVGLGVGKYMVILDVPAVHYYYERVSPLIMDVDWSEDTDLEQIRNFMHDVVEFREMDMLIKCAGDVQRNTRWGVPRS